jgi:DNA polymerase-1
MPKTNQLKLRRATDLVKDAEHFMEEYDDVFRSLASNPSLELRIDADFYAYRACQQNEEELDWGKDLITISSNFKQVTRSFESVITSLRRRFDTDRVTLYFSHHRNFRKEIDPDYKGQRTKRKPVGYRRLLDWCKKHYVTVVLDHVEADDALGVDCHMDKATFVLVSPDKDMKQISCLHYNEKEVFRVTPHQADRFFYQQVITGDPVDGYKGVPGMGEVAAKKLLDKIPPESWWEAILLAYVKAGLSEDDAIRNARLARILRPGEYDTETCSPILWNPPI